MVSRETGPFLVSIDTGEPDCLTGDEAPTPGQAMGTMNAACVMCFEDAMKARYLVIPGDTTEE